MIYKIPSDSVTLLFCWREGEMRHQPCPTSLYNSPPNFDLAETQNQQNLPGFKFLKPVPTWKSLVQLPRCNVWSHFPFHPYLQWLSLLTDGEKVLLDNDQMTRCRSVAACPEPTWIRNPRLQSPSLFSDLQVIPLVNYDKGLKESCHAIEFIQDKTIWKLESIIHLHLM